MPLPLHLASRRRFIFGIGAFVAACTPFGALNALASESRQAPVIVPQGTRTPTPAVTSPAAPAKPATTTVPPTPAAATSAAATPASPVPSALPVSTIVWIQNHRATALSSDVEGTKPVGAVPQWTHFIVTGPQVKNRLPVANAQGVPVGWIEAASVGPSGPPPPPTPVPAPASATPAATPPAAAGPTTPAVAAPPPFDPFWIAPFRETHLLIDPREDGLAAALLPQFGPLQVKGPAKSNYYPVEEPFSKATGWIDASAIGKIGAPGNVAPARWWGKVIVDQAFGRSEPNRDAPIVAKYAEGRIVGFSGWSEGEQVTWDDPAWGVIAPGVFVYGRLTRPIPLDDVVLSVPSLPSIPSGKWIGINRTIQVVVAWEDDKPQFWARTSTGRPGWETPTGNFSIIRRVAKETMDSATLLGQDAERAKYKIENVKYTQYFTNDGNALHENWWKELDTFGLPSSHGCAGLLPADALKFWEFGAHGMPVIVHL